MPERDRRWDDEPFGELDTGVRRHWRRPWNQYLAVMVGFLGVILLIGSLRSLGWDTVGALLVLTASWAVTRSDGRHAPGRRPPPPPPTTREELGWAGVAAGLTVVGLLLFAL